MKKIVYILLLVQSTLFSQYQQETFNISNRHSFGKVDSTNYYNFGLNFELITKERFGLNYNLDFIFRGDKIFQVHGSPGLLFPLSFGNIVKDEFEYEDLMQVLSFIAIFVPEGFSLHFPIGNSFDFVYYANLLGVDYMKNSNSDEDYIRYSASLGLKFNYIDARRMCFFGFFEKRRVAGLGWYTGFGAGVGYNIYWRK